MTRDDDVLEPNEVFQIFLLSTSDADVTLGEVSVANITILNDDCKLLDSKNQFVHCL